MDEHTGTSGAGTALSPQTADPATEEVIDMSTNTKIAVGGVAVGLLLLIWLPWWAALLIVLGVPAAAYLALDPSQRRRLRDRRRRQLGR